MKKTVVITGGTSGIGYACAAYLLKKEYRVIITGKSETNLQNALKSLGDEAIGYVSDTSNIADIEKLVENLKNQSIMIDALFVNAGIFEMASFMDTTEAMFDKTMDINFKGAFFTMQKFIPIMNNPSSIVLNTSIVVFKAFEATSVYTGSKAALESLSKVLNLELAEKGIRVNVISPGATMTPIFEKAGMDDASISGMSQRISATSPIGRIVEPSDIAPVLEFLISDASLILRDEKIVLDGGATLR